MADTLQVLWEGVDGSTWDLLSPFSPVRATSIEGMGMPGFTQQWAESGARDGKRYEGTTWEANTVTMTVEVGDAYIPAGFTERRRGNQWRDLDRAFRASVSPEVEGRLVVIADGGRRSLALRLDAPMSPPPATNPGLRGRAVYQLEMTAGDQPWWTGEPVTEPFRWNAGGQPFFSGGPGKVRLHVSKSDELGTAAIDNPGDRPTWMRWMATGPFESVTVGVGDQVVPLPFSLPAGATVHVDSLEQTIVDQDGVSLWPLMGYTDPTFAPVPAGEQVPLTVTITQGAAGASVVVSLVPLYEGPW